MRTGVVAGRHEDGGDSPAGSIEPGRLADLVVVEGNPLEDINATRNVRRVIANGRVYGMDELLKGRPDRSPSPAGR
jgi:hypothetical protein